MGLLTLTQIPCHHVLANEIDLNFKYCIVLKHFFNINLGIGIIKKTTFFVCIFNISPHVFTQISIERAHHHHIFFRYFLFLWYHCLSKLCWVGTRWMRNLILHRTSSPDQNLRKNRGDMSKIETKKKYFFLWYLSPNLY